MKTGEIFSFGDLCIGAGHFPGLEDRRYALLLVFAPGKSSPTFSQDVFYRCEIRRDMVSALLPRPCRVWVVKGSVRHLLGDSDLLPVDLSSGVGPPYIGT